MKRPLSIAIALLAASPVLAKQPAPIDKSAAEQAEAMAGGKTSSYELVNAYLARIAKVDDAGPRLNAVISVYSDIIAHAIVGDAARKVGAPLGPLHGITVLVKDNIDVAGPIPTTAGSLALKDNIPAKDAPIIARLRAGGAIILGKTNLSEWANFRSGGSTSGWSAVGGLVKNPHVLDRNSCGSSSGSGSAMAAGLAALTIGTETDGSITCPASINGIVGFKPTLGLMSRTGIIPISHSQDTAGPITKTVRDAAIMLSVMAGNDPADPATAEADDHKRDYAARLSPESLKGMRLGILRDRVGDNVAIKAKFAEALAAMTRAGAVLIEIKDSRKGLEGLGEAELDVLLYELKADLNAYLAKANPAVKTRTLADLIAFNKAHPEELAWFGQDLFEKAEATKGLDDPAYKAALEKSKRLAGAEGIDKLLKENKVELLVQPTTGPAWKSDLVHGDHYFGPSASELPAVAGYPHLTVPMGTSHDLPLGVSFIGTKWDDEKVLQAGYAYEQASQAMAKPKFKASIEIAK